MKQSFIAVILMTAGAAYASSPALYECIYHYDMSGISNGKDFSETANCILLIGEEQSKFYDYPAFRIDSVSAIPGVSDDIMKKYRMEHLKSESSFGQEVNISLADNKLMVFCDMAPERYKYEQTLPLITWEETGGTDTVCGYTCRKAIGEYGGKKWSAWYAEEIAVPFGPWKICRLPGLVLKATDEEGNHKFEAIAFRQGSGEVAPSKIPNQISIKHDKFIELKNDYDRNPESAINPESISEITVIDNNIVINGVKSRLNKNRCIPLEYTPSELKEAEKGESSKPKKKSFFNELFNEEVKVIGIETKHI